MVDEDDARSRLNLTFSSVRVVTSPSDHYLDTDWQTLLLAPVWTCEVVAAADKTIDEKERAAFLATLETPPPGVFAAFVFSHVRKHLAEVEAARAKDLRSPMVGIADAELLLGRYPNADEAHEFRLALIALAENVATASGGGLFGFGDKLSEAEANVIAQLRLTFHLPA